MTLLLDRAPATAQPHRRNRRDRTHRADRTNRTTRTDRPEPFAHITPNWFASVMGTGIVATAAVTLPVQVPGLRVFATVVWLLAVALLLTLVAAFVLHWAKHTDNARGYLAHPVMCQFYGAPPMALLTVGAGTVALGPVVIGATAAHWIGAVLWIAGTGLGVLTAIGVPFAMMTRHRANAAADSPPAAALPAWLMPVVPPMVSATTGAALIDLLPAGQARLTMLAACYALFGMSLVLGMMTMTLIYGRLVQGGVPTGQAAPTIWITLGMIGQSITAANLLPTHAAAALGPQHQAIAAGLTHLGIAYGLAMAGFGVAAFALAAALTVHNVRRGMPFALTWWSFTFPIGTCVTGLSALGTALGASVIHTGAVVLYVLLLAAWATVGIRTLRGVVSGRLLRPA
ncbi:TDT family transporter [Gordonia sinesedis]